MPSDFQTTQEVAEQLRRPPTVLRQWRHRGIGPRSFRIGGRVVYRASDVAKWLARQEADSARGDDAGADP